MDGGIFVRRGRDGPKFRLEFGIVFLADAEDDMDLDTAALDAAYSDRVCDLFRELCVRYAATANAAPILATFAKNMDPPRHAPTPSS